MDKQFYEIFDIMMQKRQQALAPHVVEREEGEDISRIIATTAHILLSRCYIMSDKLVKSLLASNMTVDEAIVYCEKLISSIDGVYGYRMYRPFYSNFPKEVMDTDNATLVINAILHYITDGKLVPEANPVDDIYYPIVKMLERSVKIYPDEVKVLDMCTMDDFYQICQNLLNSHTSINEEDKRLLCFIVRNYPNMVPNDMAHKENKAVVIAEMLSNGVMEHPLYAQTNSVTDVLRIAAALSNGDVSLKENTRYISFSRPIRKWMMDTIECIPGSIEEEMLKYRERWLRIGERIHPRFYSKEEYERTIDAFNILRNNEKSIVPYTSKIERAYIQKKYNTLIELLLKKPGYFARELHHLFKVFPNKQYDSAVHFASIAQSVATPVLLQIKGYYENEQYKSSTGIYFPKGNTQNMFVKTDNQPIELSPDVVNIVLSACKHGLMAQYTTRYAKEYDDTQTVYLDEQLKTYLIPNSMRSASNGLRVVPRGSRMPIGNTRYFRPLIHWKNANDRTDIDLSVAMLDKNYQKIDDISYMNLKNEYACHSGDFVDAPNGASEFINVDIEAALEHGVKYIVMAVHAYTMHKFRELPECYGGYMLISEDDYKNHKVKQAYHIENVKAKTTINNDSGMVIMCMIDLESREMIWCDIAGELDNRIKLPNNVNTTQYVISYIAQSIVESKRVNMYELARMNARAKGYSIVDNAEDANIIYTVEKPTELKEGQVVVSVFDTDVWQAMV